MLSEVVEKVPKKILLAEVNDYLACHLCRGYLIDATTITECLHSFCRSCILKFLEEKSYCPVCEILINKARPNLKLDKTLQDVVYKLVPDLFLKEMVRRRQFYKAHPEVASRLSPEQRGEDTERTIFSPKDAISLSLEFIRNDSTPAALALPSAAKDGTTTEKNGTSEKLENFMIKYLQCPGMCRVDVLKKFIQSKFVVNTDRFYIDILHKKIPLPDHYTLIDLAYIYSWKRNEPMKFYFCITELGKTDRFDSFDMPKAPTQRMPLRMRNVCDKPSPQKRAARKSINKQLNNSTSQENVVESADFEKRDSTTRICDKKDFEERVSDSKETGDSETDNVQVKLVEQDKLNANSETKNVPKFETSDTKKSNVDTIDRVTKTIDIVRKAVQTKDSIAKTTHSVKESEIKERDGKSGLKVKSHFKQHDLTKKNRNLNLKPSVVRNLDITTSIVPKPEHNNVIITKAKNNESSRDQLANKNILQVESKPKKLIIIESKKGYEPKLPKTYKKSLMKALHKDNNNKKPKVFTKVTLNRESNMEIITQIEKTSDVVGRPCLNILKQTVKHGEKALSSPEKFLSSPAKTLSSPAKTLSSPAKSDKSFVESMEEDEDRQLTETEEKIRFFNSIELTEKNNLQDFNINRVLTRRERIKRKNSSPVKTDLSVKKLIISDDNEQPVETNARQDKTSLKGFFNDNNIHIPSSLSITLKENENFAENVKIPDETSKTPEELDKGIKTNTEQAKISNFDFDSDQKIDEDLSEIARSLTEKIPYSTTICQTFGPKQPSSFSIPVKTIIPAIQPSPIPDLNTFKSYLNPTKIQSFQKIFEESINSDQKLDLPDIKTEVVSPEKEKREGNSEGLTFLPKEKLLKSPVKDKPRVVHIFNDRLQLERKKETKSPKQSSKSQLTLNSNDKLPLECKKEPESPKPSLKCQLILNSNHKLLLERKKEPESPKPSLKCQLILSEHDKLLLEHKKEAESPKPSQKSQLIVRDMPALNPPKIEPPQKTTTSNKPDLTQVQKRKIADIVSKLCLKMENEINHEPEMKNGKVAIPRLPTQRKKIILSEKQPKPVVPMIPSSPINPKPAKQKSPKSPKTKKAKLETKNQVLVPNMVVTPAGNMKIALVPLEHSKMVNNLPTDHVKTTTDPKGPLKIIFSLPEGAQGSKPSPVPRIHSPSQASMSPKYSPRNNSPKSSPIIKHMYAPSSISPSLTSPLSPLVNSSPNLASSSSKTPKTPSNGTPKTPKEHLESSANEFIEKYQIQNLAQMTAALNFGAAGAAGINFGAAGASGFQNPVAHLQQAFLKTLEYEMFKKHRAAVTNSKK